MRLFRALLRTLNHLRQVTEPYYSSHGISGPQWGVLRTLHRAQVEGTKSLRLTDLGERLLIRPPSVTGVVDRLERMGLVRRVPSKADRRVRELRLTGEGRKLVARVLTRHSSYVRSLFDGLTLREQEYLRGLLDRLDAHFTVFAGHRRNDVPAGPAKT